MINETKQLLYGKLVEARTRCDRCKSLGLRNPADVQGGQLDAKEVGPWTRWNGDLNAPILVVGQEWGDVSSFERQGGLDNAKSKTNEVLVDLLSSVGVVVQSAPNGGSNTGVFLTNAALCLKGGGAQAKVDRQWFKNCARPFLREQITLVQPRVVVTLGEQAYLGVRHAFDLPKVSFRRAVRRQEPIPLINDTQLIPVYHCSKRVLNKARLLPQQLQDWRLVKAVLDGTYAAA